MPHKLCVIFIYNGIRITFFYLKVGSIQVILDSLDVKEHGRSAIAAIAVPVRNDSIVSITKEHLQKKGKGTHYVRQLIPYNIENVDFIYKVNFQTGKGQHHTCLYRPLNQSLF